MSFRLDTTGPVAVLTFDRPPVNAFDLDLVLSLDQAMAGFARGPSRGLVITGAGGSFSAGVDTRAFAAYGAEDRARMIRGITRTIAAIYALPFPVVTAVNGHAMGGGFVVMLSGDVRLASDAPGVRLGLQEAQAGIPFPAGPLEVIRAELPIDLLRSLTLTSRAPSTAELLARGVIDAEAPAAELLGRAMETAARLADQPGFRIVKSQVRGPTQARLARLAETGADPLIDALSAAGRGR